MFGSAAYLHVPKEKRDKWDARALEGILVGFSETQKGYRVLLKGSHTVKVTRSVVIDESPVMGAFCGESPACLDIPPQRFEQLPLSEVTVELPDPLPELSFPLCGNDVGDVTAADGVPPASRVHVQVTGGDLPGPDGDGPAEPRRSSRRNKGVPPDRLSYVACTASAPDPAGWKDMQKLPVADKEKWLRAADDEIHSLHQLKTWVLTELPPGKQPFGCKWIFTTKRDKDGNVERYKARLVAQGFSQQYGEDYDATFAPVARITTLRILLTVAAAEKLRVRHFDVKTAFLNGDIEEDIFMKQPEGFVNPGEEHLVCKLQKSLYGLKQAARAWNTKANQVLLEIGFKRSQADPCLYTRQVAGSTLYVLVYVDDMLICHRDDSAITGIWRQLNEHFELKDLGDVCHYLGIEVERPREDCFLLHQTNKIDTLLDKYNLGSAKVSVIPMDPDYIKLTGEDNLLPTNDMYRKAVGELLYFSTTTRPDIACATGILCRRVSKPRQRDWDAVKKLFRYLKHTRDFKLRLSGRQNLHLTGYVDADWAGNVTDRKSTSGYIIQLGDSPISWSTRKQPSVALSTTEAEYISAAYASQEVLWLRELLEDFGLAATRPTRLFEDNQGCIKLALSEGINARTKHIDVRHHHLRDLVARKIIEFEYRESGDNVADALTKPLPRPRLEDLRQRMGLVKDNQG